MEDELILYAEGEESNCIHLRTTNSIMKCTIIEQKTRRIKVNIENEYEGIYKYFHVTTVGVVRQKNDGSVFIDNVNISDFYPRYLIITSCLVDTRDNNINFLWLCSTTGRIDRIMVINKKVYEVGMLSLIKVAPFIEGLNFCQRIENNFVLCRTTTCIITINAKTFQIQTVFTLFGFEDNRLNLPITYMEILDQIYGVFNHNREIYFLNPECDNISSFSLSEKSYDEKEMIIGINAFKRLYLLISFISGKIIMLNALTRQEKLLTIIKDVNPINRYNLILTRDYIFAVSFNSINYIMLPK